MKRGAVIVAGGSGSRMKSDVPKQFMLLHGRPILMHTIEKFYTFDNGMQIVVVLPSTQVDYWKELCREYHFSIPHAIAEGGATRFHSVKNGLGKIVGADYVAVHDGVRPLVATSVLERCFAMAQECKAVVPVVPSVDSLRVIDGNGSHAIDRATIRLVQTPQVFEYTLLISAFTQPYTDSFTDDASVVEAYGHPIALVEGNVGNVKITNPTDMAVAEMLFGRVE